jgi:MFS family permease
MNADLGLTANQFGLCLAVFFITYALVEAPSNVLLKRLKPHIWIPVIMIAWGVIVTATGFVRSFGGLLTARIFLGIAEGGLYISMFIKSNGISYPGIQFYLSCWYKRKELGKRSAIFFSAAALSGSFGGLLATAISKMDGVCGIAGWQWIVNNIRMSS